MSLPSIQPLIFLQFLGLIVFGYLVEFSFAMIAVMITFWFESGEGLEHFKWIIMSIFSGYLVPVEFMPGWLRGVVEALPFKYVYSVPIQLLQGKTQLRVLDLAYIFAFLSFIYLFQTMLWRLTVRKYTSAGG